MKAEKMKFAESEVGSRQLREKLSQKTIYFGHQSVGADILAGLDEVLKAHPGINLRIIETRDPIHLDSGVFAHTRIGTNRQPDKKIDDFAKLVNSGVGKHADMVALKFCYVDITGETDVEKLFTEYTAMIELLKQQYPALQIMHFTVPLTTLQTTWKTWAKRAVGKERIWEYEDNYQRTKYNKLIRDTYAGEDPVFDIAAIESTFPDGTRCAFTYKGDTCFAMVPQYTDDGGHLNEKGKAVVAEQLLLALSNNGMQP